MMYYGKISKTKSKKEKYAKKKVWLEEAIQEGARRPSKREKKCLFKTE